MINKNEVYIFWRKSPKILGSKNSVNMILVLRTNKEHLFFQNTKCTLLVPIILEYKILENKKFDFLK